MNQVVEVALVEVVRQALDEDLEVVVLAQRLVLAVLDCFARWVRVEI